MGADDNIKTIQSVCEAFGRGDVGAVTAFFQAFGCTMEVGEFNPFTFAANEDAVFTVVRLRAKVRRTQKAVEMNLHHYFRFRGGKIFYYRGTADSTQVEAALGAQ
jgi:ketosteroid isomerase-like protein